MRFVRHQARLRYYLLTSFFVAVFSFISIKNVSAERATPEEMESVCRNWLTLMVANEGDWGGSTAPEIQNRIDISDGDLMLAVCYEIYPEGYIIVPVLKEMPPIKAYSDMGRFNADETDGLPGLLRETLSERLELFIDRYGSLEAKADDKNMPLFDGSHRRDWDRLAVSPEDFAMALSGKTMRVDLEAGPLLTTLWDQRPPYNSLCPTSESGLCLVGCVPLAAAQIVFYHQWPTYGVGSHSYYWEGDYCTGLGGGEVSADFSDPYVYDGARENTAEICFEMGVLFEADYGSCATGADPDRVISGFPEHLRYKSQIERLKRVDYSIEDWFQIIKTEIDALRPIMYEIPRHEIVCDGYRQVSEMYQYHMNYGWGTAGYTTWFTMDNLYCYWEPEDLCPWNREAAYVNIEPARDVNLFGEPRFGQIPLEVTFQGSSEFTVDEWHWDFGDGDSSYEQSPVHTYADVGSYDVTLEINSGGESYTAHYENYVVAFADSLIVSDAPCRVGRKVEVTISARNSLDLKDIYLPVVYDGDLELALDSFSMAGCRTESFNYIVTWYNADQKLALLLRSNLMDEPIEYLQPGVGPVLKLYFTVVAGNNDQTTQIRIEPFDNYYLSFRHGLNDIYTPFTADGLAFIYWCGDANGDYLVNLIDILYLINYVYADPPGDPPDILEMSDVNADGAINLLDILILIAYRYSDPPGPEPLCR